MLSTQSVTFCCRFRVNVIQKIKSIILFMFDIHNDERFPADGPMAVRKAC